MNISIRTVQVGDEDKLAKIQIESWKAAFSEILTKQQLEENTNTKNITQMYRKILKNNFGYGFILEIDEQPHCIAYWSKARDTDFKDYAELICIHSLKDNWNKGLGSQMLKQILSDVKDKGFHKIMLWVFEDNIRARNFYEKHGFVYSGKNKISMGAVENCYEKKILIDK